MFSSQQTFTINGDNDKALEKVLQLALELSSWSQNDREIKAFYEDTNGLVLCSYDCVGSTVYPFKATIPVLVEHINQYLNKLSDKDIRRLAGEEPDNDGTVRLGWEVFHPLWYGENEIEKYELAAVIAVRPCWIVYGK